MILTNLGQVALRQGQHDRAISYHERSLAIALEIGDRDVEANAFTNLGLVAGEQGQYGVAQRYYQHGLEVRRELGDRSREALVLHHLGALALLQGEFHTAESYYRQALTIREELGQPHYQVEDWAGLALAALRQGDRGAAHAWAAQLLEDWTGSPTFEKADEPMRALYFAWQVCQELQLAQAGEILAAAVEVLQTYLDDHPDPEMQAAYLRQQYHREFWAAWLAAKSPD